MKGWKMFPPLKNKWAIHVFRHLQNKSLNIVHLEAGGNPSFIENKKTVAPIQISSTLRDVLA